MPVAIDAWPNMVMFSAGSSRFMVYAKPDHEPASYTVLHFTVTGIHAVVRELAARGVEVTRYDGAGQDEHGVATRGPVRVAWFTDPAGNIIGLSQGR